MKFKYSILTFTLLTSVSHARTTAENFTQALGHVENAQKDMIGAIDKALAIDQNIQELQNQIISHDEAIANLQQQARDISNLANQPVPPQGGGGGGGSGGGGSGGGDKGNGETPKPPELGQAPEFQMPEAPSDGGSLDALGDAFKTPERGFNGSSPDFSNPFQLPQQEPNPGFISPATVAAGKMPTLSGSSSIPNAIAGNPNAFNNTSSSPSGPSGSGSGGMGGMGGGQGAGAGGGGGGDSLASVGVEAPEGEAARPRVETTVAGVGGDGGGSSSEGINTTADADESPVKAQLAKGSMEYALAGKESAGIKNPEGRGLMGWVGWIGDSCKTPDGKKLLSVCEGPVMNANDALAIAVHKEPTEEKSERAIASAPEAVMAPVEASTVSPVRAGLLGLVSGI